MISNERIEPVPTGSPPATTGSGRNTSDLVSAAGRWERFGVAAGRHGFLIVTLLVFAFPFYWMLTASVKQLPDIVGGGIELWPSRPTLDNYAELLGLKSSPELEGRQVNVLRAFLNSTIVAGIYTVGAVFLASLGGFAFAKLRFRGSRPLYVLMLATIMVPNSVGLIPNFMIMARLNWIDTWWPLIVPSLASAFGVFWMRQYISSVPDELIEAARIDGCGPFRLYWQIVVPVILPGLGALAIFSFLGNWNSFLGPLIFLTSPEKYTLPLMLSQLNTGVQGHPTPYHLVFASSVISVLPILLFFVVAQRYFIAGLTGGSVKA